MAKIILGNFKLIITIIVTAGLRGQRNYTTLIFFVSACTVYINLRYVIIPYINLYVQTKL